jgi:hypothetical protein
MHKMEHEMTTIGYARVSTDGQSLQAQMEALHRAGCGRIYSEKQSGTYTDRPRLAKAIAALAEGDCLVVCKLDRLAMMRKPSCSISCSHSGPDGGAQRVKAGREGYGREDGRYAHTTCAGIKTLSQSTQRETA